MNMNQKLAFETIGSSTFAGPFFYNKEILFLRLQETDIIGILICSVLVFNLTWPFIHYSNGWISEKEL